MGVEAPTAERFARERAELDSVLASPYFANAPALSRFLTYICEQTFEGKGEALKEYSIAIEALGRAESFDHTKDSIVRVAAHKLRRRLKKYYATIGPRHGVHIEIPLGQYAPVFRLEPGSKQNGAVQDPASQAAAAVSPRSSEKQSLLSKTVADSPFWTS